MNIIPSRTTARLDVLVLARVMLAKGASVLAATCVPLHPLLPRGPQAGLLQTTLLDRTLLVIPRPLRPAVGGRGNCVIKASIQTLLEESHRFVYDLFFLAA
jgi:hypothetical protein